MTNFPNNYKAPLRPKASLLKILLKLSSQGSCELSELVVYLYHSLSCMQIIYVFSKTTLK